MGKACTHDEGMCSWGRHALPSMTQRGLIILRSTWRSGPKGPDRNACEGKYDHEGRPVRVCLHGKHEGQLLVVKGK